MHNYEQKVLLIYYGASPRLCHLNVALFPRLGRLSEPPAHWGYVTTSPLRGFEKEIGQIRQISQLWKKVCVFQTQSICHRPYRAGRRQAPRPTRLSVKSSPYRRYWPRDFTLGINELAARTEVLAPCALASFVNGKFNSAGVEGFCGRCCRGRLRPRLTKLQACVSIALLGGKPPMQGQI